MKQSATIIKTFFRYLINLKARYELSCNSPFSEAMGKTMFFPIQLVVYYSIDNLTLFVAQMLSEHQRIEASPNPATENTMPPPPSYEDLSNNFSSETYDELTDIRDYFLGEVFLC